MGDAASETPTEEGAEGESSKQEEKDVEIGILSEVAESSGDIVYVTDVDDNDSTDTPPASSLASSYDRTMKDTPVEDVSVEENDLENQNEEEKQEEGAPRGRLKAAALAVTGAVVLGAVRVIEQSSDVDETDMEMGPKGETEVAQSWGNDGGGAVAKGGGNDGGGAAAKGDGYDGGGAAAKSGGGGGPQSNPPQ